MPRIVHFGPGNFHRAHQAWYTQNAGGWTITGVSLRSAATRDALAGQGFDYTLVMQDADGVTDERITVIDSILLAAEVPAAVISVLADPQTHVVTATVTEKGYHLDSGGRLKIDDALAADINGDALTTFIGFLVRGIATRQTAGAGPLTVISCDNLSDNGGTLRRAVTAFANAAGLPLDMAQLSFPSTMVDRITPRPTAALADEVAARNGWQDTAPVVTEVFSEWIIADEFAGPRPDWDRAGATFVDDVIPYELRKLRMLNGGHSLMAYLGHLRGHAFVHEAVADPELRADVIALMDDAMLTLGGVTPALIAYRDALLARFANPALAHKLLQIAMDGSQKMPIRVLAPLQEVLASGASARPHLNALAAWIAFVVRSKTLDDPQGAALQQAAVADDPVAAVLAVIGGNLPGPALDQLREIYATL